MFRTIAIAAILALAVPTFAVAQNNNQHRPPPGKGAPAGRPAFRPGGPPGGRPTVQQRGPGRPGFVGGPGRPGPGFAGGPGGRQFMYHGRGFNRVHLSPFIYPNGWAYRRWAVGAILPPLFLAPAYYYSDWATLGLDPPPPGFQWVRYGPDLLLVNIATGQVVDVVYGAFY
jgi:Ni/Co efflux regulator RcnB